MKARDIMTDKVECISPDASVFDAAGKMKLLDVGFIPVCDNDRLVGTITDRDIVVRGVAEKHDLDSMKVQDIMHKGVAYVFEEDRVDEVARKMEEEEIRRVVVLNKDKRLTGVISLGDLSQARGKERLAGHITREITEAA
jgi:CBS domain-containing protein